MQTDSTDAIRLIQSGLEKLGHAPGTIDGRWGVRTARALRQLIAANGRPASVAPQCPLPWNPACSDCRPCGRANSSPPPMKSELETIMLRPAILALVRQILTVAGTALVAKGYALQHD